MEVEGSAGTDVNISPERFVLIRNHIAAHDICFCCCQFTKIQFEYGGAFVHCACRLEAFSAALGRYRHAQHVEQISVADIEGVVNSGASVPFSTAEIMTLLEVIFFFFWE